MRKFLSIVVLTLSAILLLFSITGCMGLGHFGMSTHHIVDANQKNLINRAN